MTDRTVLRRGNLAVAVKRIGAELCSLRNSAGRELLWQAGPAWPRHAPVLFPVVGRMVNDTLVHHGTGYPMPQHGFARDVEFSRVAVSANAAHFRLTDTARTRRHFPFAFALDVRYELDDDALAVQYRVSNPSREVVLPASLGVHPAFRWPIDDMSAKSAHRLEFGATESAPVRRVDNVLLRAGHYPSPIIGTSLLLDPALFTDGALILDRVSSTTVRYESNDGQGLTLSWSGFEQLAIWSPPDNADLLCIEPWCGLPSPDTFDGEYLTKPDQFRLQPGEDRLFGLRIAGLSAPLADDGPRRIWAGAPTSPGQNRTRPPVPRSDRP
jgi:galactose mutarotase-like enzyme